MSEGDLNHWEETRDKKAKERGLLIEYPADDELYIDIDDAASLQAFHNGVAILGGVGSLIMTYDKTPSPSGGEHYHIRVKLSRPVAGTLERLALQAMLGSDRKRELLCWRKLEHQGGDPTTTNVVCFFEKPSAEGAPF